MNFSALPRERWITIGTVRTGWFVFERQSGTPDGFLMAWQGRVHCFQPLEFRQWEHVLWAVARRLQIAKMEWVAMASEVPRREAQVTVRVLVRRRLRGYGAARQHRPTDLECLA